MSEAKRIIDDEERAMCVDPFGPKVRPVAYVLHVPRMTETARQHDSTAMHWPFMAPCNATLILSLYHGLQWPQAQKI